MAYIITTVRAAHTLAHTPSPCSCRRTTRRRRLCAMMNELVRDSAAAAAAAAAVGAAASQFAINVTRSARQCTQAVYTINNYTTRTFAYCVVGPAAANRRRQRDGPRTMASSLAEMPIAMCESSSAVCTIIFGCTNYYYAFVSFVCYSVGPARSAHKRACLHTCVCRSKSHVSVILNYHIHREILAY